MDLALATILGSNVMAPSIESLRNDPPITRLDIGTDAEKLILLAFLFVPMSGELILRHRISYQGLVDLGKLDLASQ